MTVSRGVGHGDRADHERWLNSATCYLIDTVLEAGKRGAHHLAGLTAGVFDPDDQKTTVTGE